MAITFAANILIQSNSQVCDEIEHLMDDDGDMAEMYLTEKKQRKEAFINADLYDQNSNSISDRFGSHSAPISPVGSSVGAHKLQRAFSSVSSSKHGSLISSSSGDENIDQLEMLLEAYFVVSDSTLNKLLSVSIFLTYCLWAYLSSFPGYKYSDYIHLNIFWVKNHIFITFSCTVKLI